ncbi:amidoxime reducing component [Tanacetum coccineum]
MTAFFTVAPKKARPISFILMRSMEKISSAVVDDMYRSMHGLSTEIMFWICVGSSLGGRELSRQRMLSFKWRCPLRLFLLVGCPQSSLTWVMVRALGMAELKVSLTKPSLLSDGSLSGGTGRARPWMREMKLQNESETRPVDPQYATGYNVKFKECFLFLLISQASLDAVNKQLKEPVSINQFTPNIFLDGCLPLADAGNGSNKVINVGDAIDVEKVFPSYADVAVYTILQ